MYSFLGDKEQYLALHEVKTVKINVSIKTTIIWKYQYRGFKVKWAAVDAGLHLELISYCGCAKLTKCSCLGSTNNPLRTTGSCKLLPHLPAPSSALAVWCDAPPKWNGAGGWWGESLLLSLIAVRGDVQQLAAPALAALWWWDCFDLSHPHSFLSDAGVVYLWAVQATTEQRKLSISIFFFPLLCNLSMNPPWQYPFCLCKDTGTRSMLISLEYEYGFCTVALLSFFTPSRKH